MRYFVGVDVGGTTTTVGVGNAQGQVLHIPPQFDTRSDDGPEAAVAAIVDQLLGAVETVGGSIADVDAVGLATPGPATYDGVLLKTPNLDPSRWDRFPIRAALERALREHGPQISVRYIGDGQAAALGEFAIRSGTLSWELIAEQPASEPIHSLFMVIVGTGLGGGAVRDGVAIRGRQGRAGHAGHIMLPAEAFRYEHDRQLVVGNSRSTVESAVSLTGLTHQLKYRLGLPDWKDHPLHAEPGSYREKAKQLRGLAAGGDRLAQELFDDQARALGIALLSVNYLGDYDRLIIGGGVCDLAPDLRQRYHAIVEQSYWDHALDGFRERGLIEFSICGDNAPVIGALAWVHSDADAGHRV